MVKELQLMVMSGSATLPVNARSTMRQLMHVIAVSYVSLPEPRSRIVLEVIAVV